MKTHDFYFDLPEELSVPIAQMQNGDSLYLCNDYVLTLQTLAGGDIGETIKQCTGLSEDVLTVIKTKKDNLERFDCAWSTLGEGTETVGRLAVLDDGCYHYVLSVMAPSEQTEDYAEIWQEIFESFALNTDQ